MQTSVTWLVEFLIKCWGLYATLYRALRWNRDLCSWDSWSHLYQFNKHKKLPFLFKSYLQMKLKNAFILFVFLLFEQMTCIIRQIYTEKLGNDSILRVCRVVAWPARAVPVVTISLYLSPQLSNKKFMFEVNRTLAEIRCLYYCHHKSLGLVIFK